VSRIVKASEWSFQILIGAPDGPIAKGHHDWQSKTGGVEDGLGHEQGPWLAVAV